MRRRDVIVNFQQFDGPAKTAGAAGAAPGILLNLFPDISYAAVLDRVDRVKGGFVWVGRIPDIPESHVTLSVEGEVMAGSVVTRDAGRQLHHSGMGP